jgi:integrase
VADRLKHGPAKGGLTIARRKGSPNWHAEYTGRDGRTHRHPLRTADKEVARIRIQQLERVEANPDLAAHFTPLSEVLSAFLDDADSRVARGDLAEASVRMFSTHARHLQRVLGEATPMSEVTLSTCQGYIDQREDEGAAVSTIGKEVSTLRCVLVVARKKGFFTAGVDATVPDYSVAYVPRVRWIAREEAWRLVRHVASTRPGRAATLAWIFGSGARLGEAAAARVGDYDAKAKRIRIRGTKTEGAARVLPVTGLMAPFLEFAAEHGDGKDGALFASWGSVRRDLGIAGAQIGLVTQVGDDGAVEVVRVVDGKGREVDARGKPNKALKADASTRIVGTPSPNDLRRSFCSWMIEDGVSHEVCARMMGHTSTAMVSRVYGRSRPESLERLLSHHYADMTRRDVPTVRQSPSPKEGGDTEKDAAE